MKKLDVVLATKNALTAMVQDLVRANAAPSIQTAAYGAKAARSPALENGSVGDYYEDRFYEEDGGALGCLYANGVQLFTALHDVCINAKTVGAVKLFGDINDYYDESILNDHRAVRENASYLGQTVRRQVKMLAQQFATDFYVQPNASTGGFDIVLPMDKCQISTMLSQARIHLGLYENTPGFFEKVWSRLLQTGFILPSLYNTQVPFDISFLAHSSASYLKPKFFSVVAKVDMGRNEGGVTVIDTYSNYQETRISSWEDAQVDAARKGRFLLGLSASEVELCAVIHLDADECRYATQSETPRAADLVEWFDDVLRKLSQNHGHNQFMTPLDKYLERSKSVNGDRAAKDRRGLHNLMVSDTTLRLIHIPDSDLGEGYLESLAANEAARSKDGKVYRQARTDKVKEFKEGSDRPFIKEVTRTVGERFIGVDWASNTMIMDSSDRRVYQDISSWAPATTYSLLRFVNYKGDLAHNLLVQALARCMRYLAAAGTQLPAFPTEALSFIPLERIKSSIEALLRSKGENLQARFTDILAEVRNYGYNGSAGIRDGAPQWVEEWLGDGSDWSNGLNTLFMPKFVSLNDSNPLRVWCAQILELATQMQLGVPYPTLCSILDLKIDSVMALKGVLVAWYETCRTADTHSAFLAADRQRQDMYGTQPEDIDRLPAGAKVDAIPHINMPNGVLPHQYKANYCLQKLPQYFVLSVSAGGGKTLMILQHAMRLVASGKAKRVAIICPAHLTDGYVNDGCYGGQGSINVVAINTKSVKDYGEEWFEHMVDAAPKNTVFVTDYKWLSLPKDAPYLSLGTAMRQLYPNAEWFRSMGFDAVILDESHFVKNDSNMSAATYSAILDVKFRGIASGTLNTTRTEDIVRQMAILDPGVFGSVERFQTNLERGTFNDPVTGAALSLPKWVAKQMEDNSMVVYGRRKEWAALLPPKTVQFHWVELSDGQRKVYQAILESTIEEIRKDERLMAILESSDDNAVDDLEQALKAYLQRIEMFLAAPGYDELSVALSEADKVSPKGKMVAHLTREHIKAKMPGKILVFTSYRNSAKAVWEALPRDLQRAFILYEAGDKFKHRARFESDPSIIGMIGVEASLNTGVNAQFCDRLIRIESVYSPGALEQGESRVNRPMLKGKDPRTALYMDWILADKSLDVSKTARLMWRSIDRAKMDNPHSMAYQDLPDLRPVRMTLDNILSENSFDETLGAYMEGYRSLDDLEKAEIADYKRRHPNLHMMDLPAGQPFEGAGLLRDIPYVPNGGVFKAEDLGLVPFGEVYQTYATHEEAVAALKGTYAHTAFGEGEIRGIHKDTVRVATPQGSRSVSHQACFIVTKKSTSTRSIREQVAQLVNLPLLDIPVPENEDGWLCWYGNKKSGAGIWKDADSGTYGVTKFVGDDSEDLQIGVTLIDAIKFLLTQLKPNKWIYVEGRELEAWLATLTSIKSIDTVTPAPAEELKPLKVAALKRLLAVGSTWALTAFTRNGTDVSHKYLNVPRTVTESNSTGVGFTAPDGKTSHLDWPAAGSVFQTATGGFAVDSAIDGLRMTYEPADAAAVAVDDVVEPEHAPDSGDDGVVPEANPTPDGGFAPYLCYVDENYGIYISIDDPDSAQYDLTKYGFVKTPEMAFMHIARWQQLKQFLAKVEASDFILTGDTEEHLTNVMMAMKTQSSHFDRYQHMFQSIADLNLTLRNRKRRTKQYEIHPYIVMYDAEIYLCVDKGINTSLPAFRSQIRVSGAPWEDGEEAWLYRTTTKRGLQSVISAMRKDGIKITNMEDVKEAYSAMRSGWKPGSNT